MNEIRYKHIECVTLLCENDKSGKLINAKTGKDGYTALHLAAMHGHLERVRELVKYKADVNIKSDGCGYTPLHIAAKNGHMEIVKFLVKSDCDPQAKVGYKYFSCTCNYTYENGLFQGDIIYCYSRDDKGSTVSELADANGHSYISKFFSRSMATTKSPTKTTDVIVAPLTTFESIIAGLGMSSLFGMRTLPNTTISADTKEKDSYTLEV